MFAKLHALLLSLFGDLSWAPPPWLVRLDRSATGWMHAHRRTTLGAALVALVAMLGGIWEWDWQQRQPKPVTVSVDLEAPGLTVLKDTREIIQPLSVKFGESVIPLTQSANQPLSERDPSHPKEIYPPITEGVSLDPPISGTWRWAGERRLMFTPKTDWPADTKYRVKLDPSLFPKHVLLAKYELETTTPAFSVKMTTPVFYTDPHDPIVKQVTATLEFTHRVDPAEVEKHVQLSVIGGAEIFAKDKPQVSVTPGKTERTVYLRTSQLTLPEDEDFLRITLEKGVATKQGGALTKSEVAQKIKIPNLYSYFKITKSEGTIVRNKEGEPEQILLIETHGAAKPSEIAKALHVYLLPKKEKKKDKDEDEWKSAKEIDEEILSDSTLLPVKLLPSDKENSELHSFKISLETEGQQLLVTIDKGVKALGGFILGEEYRNVLPVPEIPREIIIEGEGGVLALNGERKLSIKSRGVKTIEYEIARVPADQINHLVSQTRGEFQNPEFVNFHFGRENISRIATEKQEINLQGRFKSNSSAFDFSKYLKPTDENGIAMQGLFFLRAREWKEPKKKDEQTDDNAREDERDRSEFNDDDNLDESEEDDAERGHEAVGDERFVLVTDLGMIVKETADGSRDVYLASIKTGRPLGGVQVDVLAKNGVPLVTGQTEADGRVLFASLGKPVREKQPVAFVARLGSDVAFMPYSRKDRQLDFSKFDVGGVESRSGSELDAFVFTERGIYRPGDQIRVGLIVKQRDWAGKLDGLPIEVEVTDPEDDSVQIRKLALPTMGFAETSYQTAYGSRSGPYTISAYIVRHGKRDLLLGETSVIVKEFLPDRMKIESHLSKETKAGWISPSDVSAAITLRNL
ncbi:MAG TPA: MG2 domain-containing protein, partial [Chthoniobacteraceae bacterium]|nr:MG2 domain-containing protein [Chthoniobacteraceae bacterium]